MTFQEAMKLAADHKVVRRADWVDYLGIKFIYDDEARDVILWEVSVKEQLRNAKFKDFDNETRYNTSLDDVGADDWKELV